ncbi:hypothetical protein RUND412_005471 [Rhizina undulata]
MSGGESREVFLGPTTGETEEFYAYQRLNPGKEKADYLEWFQEKFGKEIELRRRRSDQPSDLEYMVIKKRSKYRERIGVESEKLCAYSEANPDKTYRELASWFQDQFGKEIDITAISRALKRSRASEASSDGAPESMPTPPPAKRGRRSNASIAAANALANSTPTGHSAGLMPTFAVDMNNNNHNHSNSNSSSNNNTPITASGSNGMKGSNEPSGRTNSIHSINGANGNSILSSNNIKVEDMPKQLPADSKNGVAFSQQIRRAMEPQSPQADVATQQSIPPTPMWTTVNPLPANFVAKPTRIDRSAASTPSVQSKPKHNNVNGMSNGHKVQPTPPHPATHLAAHPPHPASLPSHPQTPASLITSPRILRSNVPPLRHVDNALNPPPAEPPVSAHDTPEQAHLRSSFTTKPQAMGESRNRVEEVKSSYNQALQTLSRISTDLPYMYQDLVAEEVRMATYMLHQQIAEREKRHIAEQQQLKEQIQVLQTWKYDLERGNLELQAIKSANEHNQTSLLAEIASLKDRITVLKGELRTSQESTPEAPTVTNEAIVFLTRKFHRDAENEVKLKSLADGFEKAGWQELGGSLKKLVGFLDEMSATRRREEAEWKEKLAPRTTINKKKLKQLEEANEATKASKLKMNPKDSSSNVRDDRPEDMMDEREEGSSGSTIERSPRDHEDVQMRD